MMLPANASTIYLITLERLLSHVRLIDKAVQNENDDDDDDDANAIGQASAKLLKTNQKKKGQSHSIILVGTIKHIHGSR
jgi:hypothetical protein